MISVIKYGRIRDKSAKERGREVPTDKSVYVHHKNFTQQS
jgi:hypothetical protein